jgi:hypothetical protein
MLRYQGAPNESTQRWMIFELHMQRTLMKKIPRSYVKAAVVRTFA